MSLSKWRSGSEEHFARRNVDLSEEARRSSGNEGDQGSTHKRSDIPEEYQAEAERLREELVEAAAEANDELTEKYLEGGELSIEEIKLGLRLRTLANEIVLATCGSAFKNKGVQCVLDAVVDFCQRQQKLRPLKVSYRTVALGTGLQMTRRHLRLWHLRLLLTHL